MLQAPITVNTQLTIQEGITLVFEGQVIANDYFTSDVKAWSINGLVKRILGSTPQIIISNINLVGGDLNTSAWTFAIEIDTTLNALRFKVTGVNNSQIKWVCTIRYTESGH